MINYWLKRGVLLGKTIDCQEIGTFLKISEEKINKTPADLTNTQNKKFIYLELHFLLWDILELWNEFQMLEVPCMIKQEMLEEIFIIPAQTDSPQLF